jgi:hypothetical protein
MSGIGPPRDGHVVSRTRSAEMNPRTRTLEAIVIAIDDHRRRIAKVLDQLDDLQRHAVDRHPGARDGDERAPCALFACLAQRLRAGDDALRDVVFELQARVG